LFWTFQKPEKKTFYRVRVLPFTENPIEIMNPESSNFQVFFSLSLSLHFKFSVDMEVLYGGTQAPIITYGFWVSIRPVINLFFITACSGSQI